VPAACGSDETLTTTPTTAPPTTAPAAGGSASASASAEAEASAGASVSAGAADPNTISAADIPVGGGKIFADRQVVVTQPTAGSFKAFSAVCTHQQCIVGDVSDGKITCPCHLSQFNITDGSVVRGPANRALGAKTATVADGSITVT
jgi:nitrite reductase/ring-hydroxylating ferredoxin subunit